MKSASKSQLKPKMADSKKSTSGVLKFLPGKHRISLSSAPFYAAILVTFGLTLFIGIFWMITEYSSYKDSINAIRSNYQASYRIRVQEEHDNIINFIEYKRSQTDQLIEDEIRGKVQSAYSIASHTYRLHRGEKSIDELRRMVAEVLRPIRWDNGRGYYFAGRMSDGVIELFADEPWFEGKDWKEFKEVHQQDVIGELTTMVQDKGAGLYRYELIKPQFGTQKFSTIVFAKHFEPFDWFIGAGIYTETLEKKLQEDVLSRIMNMSFGTDGEVYGFRLDGTMICSQNKRFIGRSVESFIDANGVEYGKQLLKIGSMKHQGDFLSYTPDTGGEIYRNLGFVKPYRDWGWVFATAVSMADMEKAILREAHSYKIIAFKNVSVFIILFIIAVTLLLFISFYYSIHIRKSINLFTNFFRQAADANVEIRNTDLAFTEFEVLRKLANSMVKDRIHKELLLRRDELRLDTLLHLGMMDKHSLQEKYEFILMRIVRITRSREGYLALVNNTQTFVSICTRAVSREGSIQRAEFQDSHSYPISGAGLIGQAVLAGEAVIQNQRDSITTDPNCFPYTTEVCRNLDVPIFNDGKIVMVAGVCNNDDEYDGSDVRQMKMLLEGVWLHVLKTSAEVEMSRLERQIIAVSEKERSNIGRDLHDDLGSHLTGIELLSKVLQQKLEATDPKNANQLAAIRDLIRDAIEKTRRLAQGLYPAHVIEHGLEAAIEELVHEVEDLFRVQCTYSFEGKRRQLSNDLATHVYYIIREAVFNAARHGKPDNIGIFMRTDPENFSVRVVDDGGGFDDSSTRKGLGCHTMQYRARAIGAEMSINSELEGGTIISVCGEVDI